MWKSLIAVAIALVMLGALVATDLYRYATRPIPLKDEVLRYEIAAGTSFRKLASDLHTQGVVLRPMYWTVLAKLQGKTASIKAGEYRIEGPISPLSLIDHFVSGKTVQFSLTIPEGWTYRQLRQALAEHPKIQSTLNPHDDVMEILGHPEMKPEGWFFPDTYHFPKGTTDMEFLRRAFETMWQRLHKEWEGRGEGLPLNSPYDALILASIVEKETGVAEERPMIAAVFVSRLKKGMRLQTDPTVIYGLGTDYDGDIRYRDLRRDTPYNTYIHSGLPPTPIALPSGAAIHAALHPADTQALFFVGRGDGSHHFSNTYKEHRAAVVKYQLGGDASRYRSNSGNR